MSGEFNLTKKLALVYKDHPELLEDQVVTVEVTSEDEVVTDDEIKIIETTTITKIIDFDRMTKKELDKWALDHDIELDRRLSKTGMVAELTKEIGISE